jgi:hypothetical protein
MAPLMNNLLFRKCLSLKPQPHDSARFSFLGVAKPVMRVSYVKPGDGSNLTDATFNRSLPHPWPNPPARDLGSFREKIRALDGVSTYSQVQDTESDSFGRGTCRATFL